MLLYLGLFLFWIWQYLLLGHEDEALICRVAAADMVAKGISLVFFLALPTTNVRPEVTGDGIVPFLMRFTYAMDTPTNLLPSAHCLVPWLGTRFLMESRNLKRKKTVCAISFLGTFLVFASTLFTYQHVIADVLGGVAVAEIGYQVSKRTSLSKVVERWNRRFQESPISKFL